MNSPLPNFLIVGAAKSGTSSLHNYLNQHPDVFMPTFKNRIKVKEPRFFVKDKIYGRVNHINNFKEYKKLFDDSSEKARGEASVFYLFFYEEAISNIKKYLGNDVKIIIILRNPIERALSAYNHVSRTSSEHLTFEEAIRIEKLRYENNKKLTPMINYKSMGLYYKMVKAYKDNFNSVKLIFFEDFRLNPLSSVKECFEFLNINTNVEINVSQRFNSGGKRWLNNKYKWIYNSKKHFLKPLKYFVSFEKRKKINTWFFNRFTFENNQISKRNKKYLINYFREDVNRLSLLINKDLDHWLK
tara:strand:+ start:5054 stop:5953 length:900 start_codon:yes stop_codon:yes gene_type:complete